MRATKSPSSGRRVVRVEVTTHDLAAHAGAGVSTDPRPELEGFGDVKSIVIFGGLLAAAVLYVAYSLVVDAEDGGTTTTTILPYLLLSWHC